MRPSSISGKILGAVLLVLLALAVAGTVLLQLEKQPETSPVARGARLAEEAGCFACHGRSEDEPRFNLRQTGPGKWRAKSNPSFLSGDFDKLGELRDWIRNGVPAAEAAQHRELFIRMPAYKDRLTSDEIDAIAAWILAENLRLRHDPKAAAPVLPAGRAAAPDELLLAGDALARRNGCYQCHGELGQGGIRNPGSFKGYIAGFFGDDFRRLTAGGDRAEILHWLDHGRGRAIESGLLGRVARHYLDGQAIPMPGYRDQLTTGEKELLADFLLLINKTGPLSAKDLERLLRLQDKS
jgi:mono/diheme cytochrome c family protein